MNKRFSPLKYHIFKQAVFSAFLLLIFLLNSCIYAGVEKQPKDSFKGQQIIFDYKGHNEKREIALEYFAKKLSIDQNYKSNLINEKSVGPGIALYDVDNDGKEEILAYLNADGYCGLMGCSFNIIKMSNGNYEGLILGDLMVPEKIKVLDNLSSNHHDILFYDNSGNPKTVWGWKGNNYDKIKSVSKK